MWCREFDGKWREYMTKGTKPRLTKEEYHDYILTLLCRTDIKDIIGEFVPLEDRKKDPASHLRPGVEWVGLCPFHAEHSPSFTVTTIKQFYHCFGCGAHGDVRAFLVEYCGMTSTEAVLYLARKAKYWPSDHHRLLKQRRSDKK
jgi:DNA primase